MTKKTRSVDYAHVALVVGLIVVLIAVICFILWLTIRGDQPSSPKQNVTTTSEAKQQDPGQKQKSVIPDTWLDFNEPMIGLAFKYPSSWGTSRFEVMNQQPDELNKTFYKISFDGIKYITITPKASEQPYYTTLTSIKDSITSFPDSRYVLVNDADRAATIVPSRGNQDSVLYAAKSLSLPKASADAIVLRDAKKYGSTTGCQEDTYVKCYSDAELSEIKLFLQELKVE